MALLSGCATRLSEGGKLVRVVASDNAVKNMTLVNSTSATFGSLMTENINPWARNWGAANGCSVVLLRQTGMNNQVHVIAEGYN
jgi:hypothetical protein